ncbi:Protein of unknown function [Lactobacillus helveticus CIRM-BIA 951]|uniref:Uncharacterized protein n=2 Tax=Lactobacillus helveticus TaxID=1587 RepID=U6FBZ7_LACHE|nr:Protein of unknown function [Lactobacillus helveticus CIRM-BIA 951]CDI60091.1 Protein of unknown function [Lactobacillus helveticus CIRM-BIA 104]
MDFHNRFDNQLNIRINFYKNKQNISVNANIKK